MGTFFLARGREGRARSRSKNLGAVPPRSRFDGSHGGRLTPRTALRREAHFRARVSGITEGGHAFEEETVVRDLALQGALILMQHCPRLQSELQVTMETPGVDGAKVMKLRGYVVRIDSSEEKGHSAVGVVFTE